jgi:RNA-directed DNA polymerase
VHENREISCTSWSRDQDRSGEGHKPNGGRERSGEVGLRRSTNEPIEQRRATFGGGRGGKGADRGEHRSVTRVPDTERGAHVTGVGRWARGSIVRKQERFTALLHHVTFDLLRDSFYVLKRQASPGVDGVTWQEYEAELEGRIRELHSRVRRGAYRAQPSRRVYIPKADGRQRPLGIAALEDKLVQQAVVTILNPIYEVDLASEGRRGLLPIQCGAR